MSVDRLPSHITPVPAVEAAYVTPAELQARLRAGQSLLGEIRFGGAPLDAAVEHPRARIGMPQLNAPPLIEAWLSGPPVCYRQAGSIRYACNDEVLFGCIALAEAAPAAFEGTVRRQYADILALLDAQGYPHPLRMWNYFPAINAVLDDIDRYQCFCRGRFEALQEYYADQFDQRLPAASAVGSHDGELVIYFIAAKTPGRHCENPRQLSAYHYPPRYGPRSPLFARATLKRWPESGSCVSGTSAIHGGRSGADYLYISGTASIVGHESLHLNDPRAQLDETLQNIRALIERTALDDGVAFRGLDSLTHIKVYIRYPEHFEPIERHLDSLFGAQVAKLYLTADICRAELLMEIEAIARAP